VDYTEAVAFLESLTDFERLGFHRHFAETVSLDAPRRFLELLDNPERAVPAVHIAGTKGKGSTAAMLESALRHAGYRTGLFTSPHLVSFRERVRVNGEPIPEEAVAGAVAAVQPAHQAVRDDPGLQPCTFFEAYLGVAALHFREAQVDIAIYETGLGGRLDATNLIVPLVAAVTRIDYDHMYILGDTLDAIAREKAEIAKSGVPLVVARGQADEAMRAISQVAAKNGASLVPAPEVNRIGPPQKALVMPDGSLALPRDRFQVRGYRGAGEQGLDCALLGEHQATNLGVALGVLEQLAARGYTVDGEALREALGSLNWPGRFDIRAARPWLVLDCAHNPASAAALRKALPEYLSYERLALVIGMSGDKDIAGFARELEPLGAVVILTRADNPRALSPAEMASRAEGAWDGAEQTDSVADACRRARELAGPAGAVCVTGSFYVVGEAMAAMGLGV
jgi:dihydrofolate synthase/folylpolyglutamate synthase